MIESYININTNEEIIIQEKSISIPYKLLIILFALITFQFAARIDANMRKKLIKYNGNNYYFDNEHNYICLKTSGCPSFVPLLIDKTKECVSQCTIKNKTS